jgi:hypothetical protein
MSEEIEWRPVLGYEGIYSVSNTGLVRSEDRIVFTGGHPFVRKGILMKPLLKVGQPQGYLRINLRNGGQRITRCVHAIVLEAFVGPRPPKMDACHFPDPNPSNNNLNNLRWDTRQANSMDRVYHDQFRTKKQAKPRRPSTITRGSDMGSAKLTEEIVVQLRIEAAKLCWGFLTKKSKELGVTCGSLIQAIKGSTWKHVEQPPVEVIFHKKPKAPKKTPEIL